MIKRIEKMPLITIILIADQRYHDYDVKHPQLLHLI